MQCNKIAMNCSVEFFVAELAKKVLDAVLA